jgi:hypothetical protein
MFKKIEGIYNVGKTVFKKLKGNKVKNPETINPFKPNPQTKDSKQIIKLKKIPGQTKNKFKGITEGIESTSRDLRKLNQKLVGEPVTKSGVSKGKDMKKFKTPSLNPKPINKATGGRVGKMGGGMMGRRFGMKMGTPKPKTNVQKIKETFAPKKKLSPKQMKIAKLAGNPNKIDGADFKKLRNR